MGVGLVILGLWALDGKWNTKEMDGVGLLGCGSLSFGIVGILFTIIHTFVSRDMRR